TGHDVAVPALGVLDDAVGDLGRVRPRRRHVGGAGRVHACPTGLVPRLRRPVALRQAVRRLGFVDLFLRGQRRALLGIDVDLVAEPVDVTGQGATRAHEVVRHPATEVGCRVDVPERAACVVDRTGAREGVVLIVALEAAGDLLVGGGQVDDAFTRG